MKAVLKSVYLNLRRLFLNGLGFLLPRSAAPSAYASPARILFVRIDRIGDIVLSTPAISALKERYPAAELTVLSSPVTAPLLAADPRINRVIVWDVSKGWAGLVVIMKIIRGLRFDLVIDPHAEYEVKTALIAFMSGAKIRAGYEVYGRGVFFNVTVAPAKERVHFVKEAFGVLRALGIEAPVGEPKLFPSKEAQGEAGKLLAGYGVNENDLLIAVHPGGYYPSQRWLPERFAWVIAGLMSRYKTKILLIGSASERELVEKIAGSIAGTLSDRTIIKAVDLRTDVLGALIRHSSLFIGNNSGPLHMAGALKVPSISTMGPTDPVRWYPLGSDQVVLRSNLKCSPCNIGGCKSHECMNDLTVDMMMEGVEGLLANRGIAKKELNHEG